MQIWADMRQRGRGTGKPLWWKNRDGGPREAQAREGAIPLDDGCEGKAQAGPRLCFLLYIIAGRSGGYNSLVRQRAGYKHEARLLGLSHRRHLFVAIGLLIGPPRLLTPRRNCSTIRYVVNHLRIRKGTADEYP